jgi:hypothetical protein
MYTNSDFMDSRCVNWWDVSFGCACNGHFLSLIFFDLIGFLLDLEDEILANFLTDV